MKRALLFVAFMTLAGSLFAQNPENGWPQRQDRERISIDPNGQDITIDRNSFVWRPFDDTVGYSLYGSRYRKAKASKGWGVFEGGIAPAVLGGVGLAGSLGGGIPLWVKGRRELDWMLDDYAERYAPRPYAASITAGPTRNGFGLALNF